MANTRLIEESILGSSNT